MAFLALIAPIQDMLIVVGVLIGVDFVTGIWASVKRGEKITSAKLRSTVSKVLIYHIAIISGFLLERYLMDSLLPVAKLVASTIGIVEFKSIIENTTTITGKDIFSDLIKKLGSSNLPKGDK